MKTANWLALSDGMLVRYLSVCRTAEPKSNMDRPEADVWAGNFVQLTGRGSPMSSGFWFPQESLAEGHPDSAYLQYHLKMLSRCGEGWETSSGVLGEEGSESALLLALVDLVPKAILLVVGSGCCWGGNWGLVSFVSNMWVWLGTNHPY